MFHLIDLDLNILDLPTDILFLLANLLHIQHVATLSKTCSFLHQLLSSNKYFNLRYRLFEQDVRTLKNKIYRYRNEFLQWEEKTEVPRIMHIKSTLNYTTMAKYALERWKTFNDCKEHKHYARFPMTAEHNQFILKITLPEMPSDPHNHSTIIIGLEPKTGIHYQTGYYFGHTNICLNLHYWIGTTRYRIDNTGNYLPETILPYNSSRFSIKLLCDFDNKLLRFYIDDILAGEVNCDFNTVELYPVLTSRYDGTFELSDCQYEKFN